METKENQPERTSLISWAKVLFVIPGIFIMAMCIQQAMEYRSNQPEYKVANVSDAQKQLLCLAKNIYWEAASEPFEGKVAVAQVTLNRVASGQFANTVCDVVYQKSTFYDKTVCQFSWFCEPHHTVRKMNDKLYNESLDVAKMVMFEGFRLPSLKDALYYHADYVNPRWRKVKLAQIGRHIFYRGDRDV